MPPSKLRARMPIAHVSAQQSLLSDPIERRHRSVGRVGSKANADVARTARRSVFSLMQRQANVETLIAERSYQGKCNVHQSAIYSDEFTSSDGWVDIGYGTHFTVFAV